MPEDAKEAIGHGIRAKRSKSGAISFDLLEAEAAMHRSSDTIGAHRRRAGQGPGRAHQPGEIADRDHPLAVPARRGPDAFAMRRCPAASTSFANASASMRSRPFRRPRSTRTRG